MENIERGMGLIGRMGLDQGNKALYYCKEDPDDIELRLFKKMRRHMEIRFEKVFEIFKVIHFKICEGLKSRTYLVKIKVNKTEIVHAAIRR